MKLTKLDFLIISDLTQQPIKTLTTTHRGGFTSSTLAPTNLPPLVEESHGPTSSPWCPPEMARIYMVYLPENGRNSSPDLKRGFVPRTPKEPLNIFQSHQF